MSEGAVTVVRVGKIGKHPNADTLSITHVFGGYPCIVRTGDFAEGDLAAYVPVDSVVPVTDPRFAFLGPHPRIKAKRLRGIFSMGLLVKPDPAWTEGQDVGELLGITKYEPPADIAMNTGNEKDPGFLIHYDIEGYRKYTHLLPDGMPVVITEKIHGANARFAYHQDRFWVGSHTCFKLRDDRNMWWQAAAKYDLEARLATRPGIALYAEVYGQVQDLRYGATAADPLRLAAFDVLDIATRRWLPHAEFIALMGDLDIPAVPVLYRGPWSPDLVSLAEGKTTMPGADHVREGMVIRPQDEQYSEELGGRLQLKLHGEGYLLRKEKA